MRTIILSIITLITLCVASCSRSNQNVFTKSDMPAIKTGSWWRYYIVDSTRSATDTLTLTVASSYTNGKTQYFNCITSRGGIVIDSSMMRLSDTAFFYDGDAYLSNYQFRLPFNAGGGWLLSHDSIYSDLRYGTYDHIYPTLNRTYDGFTIKWYKYTNSHMEQRTFGIARKIGLIYSEDYSIDSPSLFKSEQLIDYHL